MSKKPTVKIIEYSLAKSADEKEFLKASQALMPEIAKLKGFIKRELLRGENGRWRDVVYWESKEDADRSEYDIPNIPACVTCIALMDHENMNVSHFTLEQVFEK